MALEKIKPFIVDGTQDFTFGNATVTGNITSNNANLGNLATANFFSGTLTTNSQPNITSVGTLENLSVTGNISTGNIKTNNLLYANGSPWQIGTTTTVSGSNTQVQFNDASSFGASANFTFDKSTNTLTVTNLVTNGSGITNITGTSVTGQVPNALVSSTVYTNSQPNITSVGTLTSLTVSGEITGSSANLSNTVTANYFVGSGNNLSNIQGSSVTGAVAYATTANSVTGSNVSGAVTYAATANAVAGGNVFGAVSFATSATVANVAYSVDAANINGQLANSLVAGTVYANAQPNITSVGTLSNLTSNGTINFTGASNVELGTVANVRITGGSANYILQTDGSGNLSWVDTVGSTTPGDIIVDNFTGNGTDSSFTLSVTPDAVKYVMVNIDGVLQLRQSYSLTGNVLTFGSIPLVNSLIEVSTTLPGTILSGGTDLGNIAENVTPLANVTYDLGSPTKRWKDLYLANNTIYLGDTAVSANSILPINLDIAPEVLAIQVAAPDAGDDTTWFWTWNTSTLPYARSAIINSPQVSVPLYQQGTYTLNNFAANEVFGNMTQVHDGYFKWIDGAGTQNLVSWAVNNGNVNVTHPDINGGNSTSVERYTISVPGTLTIPTLNTPSAIYAVSFVSAGSYTIGENSAAGIDHLDSAAHGPNKNLGPLYRGGTYTFNLHSSIENHPFYLTTDNGAGFVANAYIGEYTSGVTGSRNNGTTGKTTLTFTVPNDAPDTLFYQCGIHSSMRGVITIKNLAVETNINGNYVIYFQHTGEGHKTPIEIRPIPSLVNQMCVVYDASVGKFVPQDLATYVENTPSFKNKIREVAGTATLIAPNGVAVVPTVLVVEDTSYLPLVNNKEGDIAFDTYTNTIYVWHSNIWNYTKSTSLPGANVTGTVASATTASNLSANTISVTGNIVPTANVTYNLGNATNRFKDLYLSGNTIDLGGQTISANADGFTFTTGVALPANTTIGGATISSGGASTNLKTYYWKGGLVENVSTLRFYIPTNSTLTKINTNLGTAGLTQATAIVKKNGATINTITIPANTIVVNQTLSIALTAGDYLTVDITQSSSASDLYINFIYQG